MRATCTFHQHKEDLVPAIGRTLRGRDLHFIPSQPPTGTTKREVYEMRACRTYVSIAIKQARIASGMQLEEFEAKMGIKPGRTNLSNVERGSRILPLDYLAKVMTSRRMRAVIVRPSLVNWNPISRTHTLEQMLTEIGEPVYRWKRKDVVE